MPNFGLMFDGSNFGLVERFGSGRSRWSSQEEERLILYQHKEQLRQGHNVALPFFYRECLTDGLLLVILYFAYNVLTNGKGFQAKNLKPFIYWCPRQESDLRHRD